MKPVNFRVLKERTKLPRNNIKKGLFDQQIASINYSDTENKITSMTPIRLSQIDSFKIETPYRRVEMGQDVPVGHL